MTHGVPRLRQYSGMGRSKPPRGWHSGAAARFSLEGLLGSCLLLAALSGCAGLPFLPKPDAAAPPVASAASAPGPNPNVAGEVPPEEQRAVYRLQVNAPGELRALLARYLDLARFQTAPETETITVAELDRLVAAAPAQARALLETEGFFNSEVKAQRLPASAGEAPTVLIEVNTGPRAQVSEVTVQMMGELKAQADAGDSSARDQLAALERDWGLKPGARFSQSGWSGAKATALTTLRADGYPAASWASTLADVDADTNTVRLGLTADSGPLYRLGPVQIEGLQRYNEAAVRNLALFSAGERYSEKRLLDYQERLQRLGLFEGASVELDAAQDTAQAAPVKVRVREQPLQQATVGVGFSDQAGQRVSLEHLHRRAFNRSFFGTDWTAKNKFELGRDQQAWEGDMTSYPLDGGYRYLLAGNLLREDQAGTQVNSSRLRVGRSLDTERIERLVFAELLNASTRSAAGYESNRAASGNYHWTWRDLDSVLLPTRGLSAHIEAGAGYAIAGDGGSGNGPFGRGLARLTAYRPLGDAWFTSARIEVGQVFAQDSVGVPDTLLFRAGGDDSVRGYGYRSLGPVVNGVVTSGRVLLTASAEIARPISPRLPAIWWALFVDAGDAADRWNRLDPVLGYGAGVRWRSPVGPLRLDLAYGQELRKFRLHLSVGIAF